MDFNKFLITIGGLYGLWNGLSLYDIKNKLSTFASLIISKFKTQTNITKFKNIIIKGFIYMTHKIKV
jgi:hypothetical protein